MAPMRARTWSARYFSLPMEAPSLAQRSLTFLPSYRVAVAGENGLQCVGQLRTRTASARSGSSLGRYFARDWIAKKIEGNATFSAIDRAVADEGWKIVLLTRLSPMFPYVLLNYAFGITRVSLRAYVLASWIGMMPGTVLYVYLGSLARAGVAERQRTPGEWALYVVGLLATISVAVMATRIARRALAKRTTPVS